MRLKSIRVRGLDPYITESYLDVEALPGKLAALIGPNGAGKSTLLNFFPAATVALNKKFLKMPKPDGRALSELSVAKDSFVEVKYEFGQDYTVRHSINGLNGKTDCSVTDASGQALLKNKSGVTEFLGWAAEHALPPEVFFGSVFSSQGTRGMLGMDPAERKTIILRVRGLERIEQRAEVARSKRLECDKLLAVASGKLQELTGDTIEFCEQQLLRLTDEKRVTDEALRLGELTLKELQDKNAASEKLRTEYGTMVARRRELEVQEQKLKGRIAELDQLITNCQTILADREVIESAAEDVKNLNVALANLKSGEAVLRVDLSEAQSRAREKRQELQRLNEKLAGLNRGIETANKVLSEKDKILAAVESEKNARSVLSNLELAQEAAWKEVEKVQSQGIVSLGGRLDSSLDAHRIIAAGNADRPSEVSQGALDADGKAEVDAKEHPAKLTEAKTAWQESKSAVDKRRVHLESLARLAARASEIKDAEQIVAEAKQEIAELRSLSEELPVEIGAADLAVTDIEAALTSKVITGATTQKEIERLTPIASKAPRIEEAQTKIVLRREERGTVEAEREGVLELLSKVITETIEPPPLIPLSDHELAVSQARQAANRADAALSIAQDALTRAIARETRRVELQQEVTTLGQDTADWKRLADDLGKSGVQALEVDAAAPELTTLANDLLRASGDTRFSLKISTTRMDSTGNREIEGFIIEITDSRKPNPKTGASGGEVSYINKALAFGLTIMACRHAGISHPTIIDDEGDAALDVEYAAAYVLMLRRAAEVMDASKVLFVTHRPDSWNLADSRISIGEAGAITVN